MNIVSFGGGTNSAALLIGLYKHKIPIDLITFAAVSYTHLKEGLAFDMADD